MIYDDESGLNQKKLDNSTIEWTAGDQEYKFVYGDLACTWGRGLVVKEVGYWAIVLCTHGFESRPRCRVSFDVIQEVVIERLGLLSLADEVLIHH